MLDPFDFKEPRCSVCGGREFYAPKKDDPDGTIPVDRIMERLDKMFEKNDLAGAQSLLEYWENEARALKDRRGELSVVSELIGLYRKTGDKEKGLNAAARGTELVRLLELENTVSGADRYFVRHPLNISFSAAAETFCRIIRLVIDRVVPLIL